MSRVIRSENVGLDGLLAALPASFVTCPVDDAWLVAGPPGVSLVIESTPAHPGLRDAEALASRLRVALADHLTLAPYVHPVLVAASGAARRGGSIVARGMLREVLTEGLTLIDTTTLDRIRELADRGLLEPGSDVGTGARGWLGAPSLH